MAGKLGQPFTLNGAKHFCRSIDPLTKPAIESFRDIIEHRLQRGVRLVEGTPEFEEFRVQAIREVDRQLFLAVSNHRRAEDLLVASSASWSWVTMYYSSYHAASTILGCLGVTVNPGFDGVLIDVARESAGSQTLNVRPCPKRGPTIPGGSHRAFWDFFYHYMASFKGTLPPSIKSVADPVARNPAWQIERRNSVNYDTFVAINECAKFSAGFHSTSFPACLDPDFGVQRSTTVAMVDAALWLTNEVGLRTDAWEAVSPKGSRRQRLEAAIQRVRPPLPVGRPLFERTIPDSNGRSLHA
jgi:hypothetical protein